MKQKYFVTLGAMDQDVHANPMWHSLLLLSKTDEKTGKVKVVDNWGFYGLPSTDSGNPFIRSAKLAIGLDVDFYGNHGMWRHEEARYLDRGKGVHGSTFELTEEQYDQLNNLCRDMESGQQAAIDEAVKELNLSPLSEYHIYPYENNSVKIFEHECKKNPKNPRLHPFIFNLSYSIWGPNFNGSHDCKTQAIELLEQVLTPKQIAVLTENEQHRHLPRKSGPVELLYLHSTGPVKLHHDKHAYRDLTQGAELYWTIPLKCFGQKNKIV